MAMKQGCFFFSLKVSPFSRDDFWFFTLGYKLKMQLDMAGISYGF